MSKPNHRRRKKPQEKPPTSITAMYEITAVLGPFIDVESWDQPGKPIRNLYTNAAFMDPLNIGDVYMLTIRLEEGFWKVIYASPKYQTQDFVATDDLDEDCPICQELKKEMLGSAH